MDVECVHNSYVWMALVPSLPSVVAAGACTRPPGRYDGAIDHRVFVMSIGCEMLASVLPYTGLGPLTNGRLSAAVAPTESSRPGNRSLGCPRSADKGVPQGMISPNNVSTSCQPAGRGSQATETRRAAA